MLFIGSEEVFCCNWTFSWTLQLFLGNKNLFYLFIWSDLVSTQIVSEEENNSNSDKVAIENLKNNVLNEHQQKELMPVRMRKERW